MKIILVACFALFAAAAAVQPVSQWTLSELSEAIQDPSTDPILLPYLEQALDDMMLALWHGVDQSIATVVLPAAVVEALTPVVVEPVAVIVPVVPDTAVVPVVVPEAAATPVVEATQTQSSPLVQIILNINQASAAVVPEAVATPVVEAPAAAEVVGVAELPAVGETVVEAVLPEAVVEAVLPEIVGVAVLPESVSVAVLPETVVEAVLPESVVEAVLPEGVSVAALPETVVEAVLPESVVEAVLPVNPIDAIQIESVDASPAVTIPEAGTMIG